MFSSLRWSPACPSSPGPVLRLYLGLCTAWSARRLLACRGCVGPGLFLLRQGDTDMRRMLMTLIPPLGHGCLRRTSCDPLAVAALVPAALFLPFAGPRTATLPHPAWRA